MISDVHELIKGYGFFLVNLLQEKKLESYQSIRIVKDYLGKTEGYSVVSTFLDIIYSVDIVVVVGRNVNRA